MLLGLAVATVLTQGPPWPVWSGAAQLPTEDRCKLVIEGLDYCKNSGQGSRCGNFYREFEKETLVDVEVADKPDGPVPYPRAPDGGMDGLTRGFSGTKEDWEALPWEPAPGENYSGHLFATGEGCAGRAWRVLTPAILVDPKTPCLIYQVVLVPEPGARRGSGSSGALALGRTARASSTTNRIARSPKPDVGARRATSGPILHR
jgi:hypothetical protein